MKIIDLRAKKVFVHAHIVRKPGTLEDVCCDVLSGLSNSDIPFPIDYNVRCKVDEIVIMDKEEYEDFTSNLTADRDWLKGKGGFESDDERLPQNVSFWNMTEEQRSIFRASVYNHVIAVKAPDQLMCFVDPEGYSYGRYVGIASR